MTLFGTASTKLDSSSQSKSKEMWTQLILLTFLVDYCLTLQDPPVRQLPSQNTTSTSPFLKGTSRPGKWPPTPARIDAGSHNIYIMINDYGSTFDRRSSYDILSNIALIAVAIEFGGIHEQSPSTESWTKGIVTLRYPHQRATNRLSRRELLVVLDTIGALIILDGPREIRTAYFIRELLFTGMFSLTITLPGPFIHGN